MSIFSLFKVNLRPLVLMRGRARTKIAKNKHGADKTTVNLFALYLFYMRFFLLTITNAVVGLSRLLEEYIRKFQDAKNLGILQDFRHGFEDPAECSACAV